MGLAGQLCSGLTLPAPDKKKAPGLMTIHKPWCLPCALASFAVLRFLDTLSNHLPVDFKSIVVEGVNIAHHFADSRQHSLLNTPEG